MSEITPIFQQPPEHSVAEQTLAGIEADLTVAFAQYKNAVLAAFAKYWHGEVPTEQLVALMGNRACSWFDRHQSAIQYFLQVGVDLTPSQYIPPRPYTRNDDGTVTLGPLPEPEPTPPPPEPDRVLNGPILP